MDMTSEGSGQMFEGDFTDMSADKIPLMSMGGQGDLPIVRRQGASTPFGAKFFISGKRQSVSSIYPEMFLDANWS